MSVLICSLICAANTLWIGLLQDPEGILSAPQGGHISRRFLAKEVERNKELQTEVDRLKKEKNEELQQQRDV